MSNRSVNNVFIIVRRFSVIFGFFTYMESINSIAVLDNDCGIVSGVVTYFICLSCFDLNGNDGYVWNGLCGLIVISLYHRVLPLSKIGAMPRNSSVVEFRKNPKLP